MDGSIDLLCLNAPYIPMFSRPSRSPCVTRGGTLYYPVSLGTMGSYAQENGFKVVLLDAIARKMNRGDVIDFAIKKSPVVIVVDTSTPSIYNDVDIADEIQKKLPKSKVLLVGRHVSHAPVESLKLCRVVDAVVRSEFYKPVVQILEGKDYTAVNGVSFRFDGKIKHNKGPELVNPDDFGVLSKFFKEQLDIEDYFFASIRNPYIMLQLGYGCPYNCAFCNELVKNNWRHKSLENSLREVRFVKRELPMVKEILWDDPTFVVDEGFMQELANGMIERKLKINWSTMTRANISLKTLKVMKKSGARSMHIGLESVSQETLDFMHKGMFFENEIEYLKNCKQVGILNHACWILGFPGDTVEGIKKTIEIAKKLPAIDSIQIFPLIPIPVEDVLNKESEGTIWDYVIKNKNLITRDYSKWLKPDGSYNCVVSYPHLSKEQIEEMIEEFYKEWYYRPSFVFHKVKQSLTSFTELKRNIRGFKHMNKRTKI
jgi:radical SAM superfamily enzyme YgiQ (UPF0313 family)